MLTTMPQQAENLLHNLGKILHNSHFIDRFALFAVPQSFELGWRHSCHLFELSAQVGHAAVAQAEGDLS